MKTLFYLLSFTFLCLDVTAVKYQNKKLSFENEMMSRTISFENNKVAIISVKDKLKGAELICNEERKPYFEFVINNRLITSEDPVWKYKNYSERALENGGTELTIRIDGLKNLDGLRLEIQKQYYPQTTLVRERLFIYSTAGKKFHLNKLGGEIHFVFPQYTFLNKDVSNEITEIRIATYGKEILQDISTNNTYDERVKYRNLSACHMFHPETKTYLMDKTEEIITKGPFNLVTLDKYTLIYAYEHASQDGVAGMREIKSSSVKTDDALIDLSQGVKGDPGYVLTDRDFWFIGIKNSRGEKQFTLSSELLLGGYLDNEEITKNIPYETAWNAIAFTDNSYLTAENLIRDYLLNRIAESPKTRKPLFYYNTWGMQRESQGLNHDVRDSFTEERILEEIEYASTLNVDVFIMDDGWQETMGLWAYNKKRLPNGLNPLVEEIKKRGMIPGIWLSPLGIDSSTQRYKDHPDWVIKDKDGAPILGQWDHPTFDMVGGFSDLFISDCKKLIDQGFLYFKWDAINRYNSSLPGLRHGESHHNAKERGDRYNYLMPFYIVKAMRELRKYNPEVIIEIDLTEPERCMVGLMPFQEGKFFWMNNGSSAYNDYTTFRTKSMRTIINEYRNLIPSGLFTFAQYPHNVAPYHSLRYNVNTSLLAGHGFWGNLKIVKENDRMYAGKQVLKSKQVLPHINDELLEVTGRIGSTPEIYAQINKDDSWGQVIAFSGSAIKHNFKASINPGKFLCALNHSYVLNDNYLSLPFEFLSPDDTRECFILSNKGIGVSVLSSSGWIDNAFLSDDRLTLELGSESVLVVSVHSSYSFECSHSFKSTENDSSRQIIQIEGKKGDNIIINYIIK